MTQNVYMHLNFDGTIKLSRYFYIEKMDNTVFSAKCWSKKAIRLFEQQPDIFNDFIKTLNDNLYKYVREDILKKIRKTFPSEMLLRIELYD